MLVRETLEVGWCNKRKLESAAKRSGTRVKKEMEEREGSWSKADAMNFSRRAWPVQEKMLIYM